MTNSFDSLAAEYYLSDCHPTCSALRNASLEAVARWVVSQASPGVGARSLEIGAGRSAWADCEELRRAYAVERVVATDRSMQMLAHSKVESRIALVVGDALELPFRSEAFDLVLGVLFDSYVDNALPSEAYRCLRPNGCFVATSPSWEWAHSFRDEPNNDMAEFVLRSGHEIQLRSRISPLHVQTTQLKEAHFRDVRMIHVAAGALRRSAPKLSVVDQQTPVVTAFIGQK